MASPTLERFDLAGAPLDEGTVLLEASAGTGKTYTLTGILVRMLLEGVIEDVEEALVVTFTVAAADELKNRLRQAIHKAYQACLGNPTDDEFFAGLATFGKQGAGILRRALDDFDRSSVMTIHGFCKRLLDESAFESDEPFEMDFAVDEVPLWHAAAADALRMVREHDCLMLGALLQDSKLDPTSLAQLYRNWQRHPDVGLRPAEPQLAIHLDTLRARLHSAAALWDDELLELVADFNWLAGKGPTGGDLRQYFELHSQPLAAPDQQPELCLGMFRRLSKARLDKDLKRTRRPPIDHPFFEACDEIATQLAETLDHLRSELLLRMRDRLERIKQRQAVLTFDDLLARTHAAVIDPKRQKSLLQSVQQRYSVALIDEFQDTDERQYAILGQCFRNRPLFLVGDPKQSIYSFRGADLDTYLEAVREAVARNTLQVNYRSADLLVQAVNRVFGGQGAFVEPGILMPKVRANAAANELLLQDTAAETPAAPLCFRLLAHSVSKGEAKDIKPEAGRQRIARDVTAEIRRLLNGSSTIEGRQIRPSDIAVLTRRNVEAILIQEHLRDAGLISVIGKAGDVFETDELQELERLLLAIQRPNDLMLARAALTTRIWGYTAEQLAELEADEGRLEVELNRLERWRHLWIHQGFIVMKERLLHDLDVHARLLARNDGERRLTNLQQLCEMLHQAEHEHRLSPEGLLHWLQHERTHKDEIDYQRRELRLESDEDAIQILTMHGSKGLQYEIVFCPFLWDGRKANNKQTILEVAPAADQPRERTFAFEADTASDAWLATEADRLAEDVRLAYVALTRARRRCYVHWGPIGHGTSGYSLSALAWLLQPDPVDRSSPSWARTWPSNYKTRSANLATDLHALADASDGAIDVVEIDEEQDHIDAPPPEEASNDEPNEQPAVRPLPSRDPWLVHSFSSWIAGSEAGTHAHEVRDPAAAAPEIGQGIFGFARGAAAGVCLHTVLEHVNLGQIDTDRTRRLVDETLAQHGLLDPNAHPGDLAPTEAVLQNLRDLAAARVHADGPTILDICSGDQIAEWKFTIRTGRPDFASLADAFQESDCPIARGYAERLRQLKRQHFEGFLTGFVDLITAADGRYWILDWKSNHLGNAASDYGPTALQAAMHGHDYVLQYHLYALAWHRHLGARLQDYDYDRDFGGVSYAFLRGAQPGATSGMFYARPPKALIDALDAWAEPSGHHPGGDQ